MSQIGNAIRCVREERGWSQEHLARRASEISGTHVPTVTVGNIERGTIKSPGLEKLGPIADALGVTIDYLRNPETSAAHDNISS